MEQDKNLVTVDSLAAARDAILRPAGLDDAGLERALGALLGSSIDGGDLYFQVSREEHWSLEDGIVKDGSHSIEQGVGVRAIAGDKTGFAYSDEIQPHGTHDAEQAEDAQQRDTG